MDEGEVNKQCPKCSQLLYHSVGEDEFDCDVLIPYDRLYCNHCSFWCDTEDYDDYKVK